MRRAWADLRDERQVYLEGAGQAGTFILRSVPLPLAWSSFDRWARRYAIDGQSFEDLWLMLQALDAEYLSILREKRAETA